jgi:acyl phosphate:glycerol-3-phosphate acyltransferase
VGDVAKGWLAVLAARLAGLPIELVALVGLAAFVGHVFPVWLRFNGGKGVATAAGVLIAFDWRIGLGAIAAWLVVALATRYSSLGSLVAAVAAPVLTWWLQGTGPMLAAVAAMGAILFVRHRRNIVKLARGEESRIGEKKSQPKEAAG